jgi:hypothetical protein
MTTASRILDQQNLASLETACCPIANRYIDAVIK